MDKAVFRSLLQRSLGLFSGIATTFTIPLFLSPEQQGYYYTFASILAIQIFFELGLSQVLLYKFSSFAPNDPGIQISKDFEQSANLLYVSRRIYMVISILFFVVATLVGLIFFSRSHHVGVEWQSPWIFLALFTSINLAQSIKFVFLESHGGVANVATFRLKLNIFSSVLFLVVLAGGGGLWSAIVAPAANSIASTYWLYKSEQSSIYRGHRRTIAAVTPRAFGKIWRQDIFPLQWRMSLSWLSGYFIFQLITPITFNRFGPVVAGQLGFAVSAMNSILFIATTFTTAISPRLATLFHSGQMQSFNLLFDRSLKRSVFAIVLLSQSFVFLVFSMTLFRVPLESRFLPWRSLLIYSFSVILSAAVYCLATYLRSQSIEPLVLQSAITALIMSPTLWVFSSISLEAMLLAMLVVTLGSSIAVWRIYADNRKRLTLGTV